MRVPFPSGNVGKKPAPTSSPGSGPITCLDVICPLKVFSTYRTILKDVQGAVATAVCQDRTGQTEAAVTQ
jgi:hypothetical protein